MKTFFLACSLFMGLQAHANYEIQKFPGKVTISVDPRDLATTPSNAIDVLFVIDNSGSMGSYQQKLSDLTPLFVDAVKNMNRDFRVGFISTDTDNVNGNNAGVLLGNPPIIDNQTPALEQALSDHLLVGTFGSAVEQPFASLEASLSVKGGMGQYLRKDAALAIVFITDAEDQSPGDVKHMLDLLKVAKGSLDKVTAFSWIVPTVATGSACPRDTDGVTPVKIEDLTKELHGTTYNLCDVTKTTYSDFADKLSKFGTTTSSPGSSALEIPLTVKPDMTTIKVTYGSETLIGGDINYGWVYNAKKNVVILGDDIDWSSQPAATKIEISFVPADWQK